MDTLLKLLERWRPKFETGPLRPLWPVYEALETFLFTPAHTTDGPPHLRDQLDMKRYMITVLYALVPCILFGMYNAGVQAYKAAGIAGAPFWPTLALGARLVLPIIITSYAVGGLWEVLFAAVRKHEINEGFLITGILFPLTLPPTIPLWQVAAGISFGVVIAKEIFGGVGFNVLNPALAARAFLYFAYPAQISGDRVWAALPPGATLADGFSGATSLAVAKAAPAGANAAQLLADAGFPFRTMVMGFEPGSIGETSAIAVLLGALLLLLTGTGSWRIMAGGLIGLLGTAWLVGRLPPSVLAAHPFLSLPPHYHLVMGSSLFGIVFMATDPVSAAATNEGKWIYGALIGALTVIVRAFNPAYPEGTMLAILFMNVMAPLLDYLVLRVHIRNRRRYLESFARADV
ncbi:MAG: NADH:ubiquinone reductase (Na(+)-transporting) subunit B [Kiritimatiellae bacterium]|nr:NADH:ubiquinone reductase (Na(+)-transporting) subunit B [Kiritimatiellia bacterium]